MILPQERVIIEAISLDEEIQLEREEIAREMRPIDAAWAAYDPKATWPQPLPMLVFHPRPYWGLNIDQIAYLAHIVYQGEVGLNEVVGLVHHLSFRSGWDLLQEKYHGIGMDKILAAADLMAELRCGQ